MTVDTFKEEIEEARGAFEKYIVCIDKPPDQFESALRSLMEKAIKAYNGRGPNLRHGIALDRQVTVILSQTDSDRPLCGIYFNLHSPYRKKGEEKEEQTSEGSEENQGNEGSEGSGEGGGASSEEDQSS